MLLPMTQESMLRQSNIPMHQAHHDCVGHFRVLNIWQQQVGMLEIKTITSGVDVATTQAQLSWIVNNAQNIHG
jgi:hypothetical protein